MNKIYFLEAQGVRFEEQPVAFSDLWDSPVKCGFDTAHHSSRKRSEPLHFYGPLRPVTDILWSVEGHLIVERRVGEMIRDSGLDGFEQDCVTLHDSTGIEISGDYVSLRATGWGGLPEKESGIQVLSRCPACKFTVYSGVRNGDKVFNLEEWDGSDFFSVWPLPGYIFVTGRVRDVFTKLNLSGVRFVPISSLACDPIVPAEFDRLTPGTVCSWYDAPRATEIEARVSQWIETLG